MLQIALNLVRRERDGGPIGSECLVRLGTAPHAGLRVLILHGNEMGNEGRVPVAGLALRRIGNRRKRNQRATLGRRRDAVRLDIATGRAMGPKR